MLADFHEAQREAAQHMHERDAASDGQQARSSGVSGDASTPHILTADTPGALSSEAPASPSSSANTDAHTAADAPGPYIPADREWLYRLVTFPSYFTPCPSCCGTNKAPKREQLVTHFDTAAPYEVYCSHCPEHKTHAMTLLQVRRSAFKDVVKATDILQLGCDILGVQQYTLNGSKVVYLSREQSVDKKGTSASAAPAVCSVDGRAMMDRTSTYCSLKCKLQGEDAAFVAWLQQQDPSLIAAATAAANAPPRPTIACKRIATAAAAPSGGAPRPKKAARTGGATTPATTAPPSPQASARPVARSRATKVQAAPPTGAAAQGSFAAALPQQLQLRSICTSSLTAAGAGGGQGQGLAARAPYGLEPLVIPGADDAEDDAVLVSTRGSGGLADWMDASAGLDHALSSTAAWCLMDNVDEQQQQQLPQAPAIAAGTPASEAPMTGTASAAAAAAAEPWQSGSPSFQDMFSDGMDSGSWGDDMMAAGDGSSGSSSDWWFAATPPGDFDADMGFGSDDSCADMLKPLMAPVPVTPEPLPKAPEAQAKPLAAPQPAVLPQAPSAMQAQAPAAAYVSGPGAAAPKAPLMMAPMPYGYGIMGSAGFASPSLPFFSTPWMASAPMTAAPFPVRQQQQQQAFEPAGSHAAAAAAMAAAAASVSMPGGNKEWTYSAPAPFFMAGPMRCPGCGQPGYAGGGFCSVCVSAAASRQRQQKPEATAAGQ